MPSVSSVDNLDCAPWKIDLSVLCTLAKISLVSQDCWVYQWRRGKQIAYQRLRWNRQHEYNSKLIFCETLTIRAFRVFRGSIIISGPRPFFKKISSKISSEATKNSRWSVPSVSSVDKFFRNILMLYTEKCVPLYATRKMMTRGSLRKTSKIRIYMMPVNNYMAPSPQPVIANDSIK